MRFVFPLNSLAIKFLYSDYPKLLRATATFFRGLSIFLQIELLSLLARVLLSGRNRGVFPASLDAQLRFRVYQSSVNFSENLLTQNLENLLNVDTIFRRGFQEQEVVVLRKLLGDIWIDLPLIFEIALISNKDKPDVLVSGFERVFQPGGRLPLTTLKAADLRTDLPA